MLMQMPGPRDIVIYWPDPRAFSVVQKPWGWAHILVQKPWGARGDLVTGQIDTCIILIQKWEALSGTPYSIYQGSQAEDVREDQM